MTHKSSVFRDLMIIETAIKTGMRRAELANLLVRHINFGSGSLTVGGGKGSRDRVIPITNKLELALEKLCSDKELNDRVFGLTPQSLGLKINDWENIVSGKNGIVIAGTGLGHINSELLDVIEKTSKDVPVAMSSQCLSGSTNLNVYRNGRKLLERGVIETYDMLPETALVKMMWLSKHHQDNVRDMMGQNLVGEISNSRKLN